MADIRITKVAKVYGKTNAVMQDVDLTIHGGEFVVILGPSAVENPHSCA